MEVKDSLSCLLSQEKPLNKSLQRGEDPQFDQVPSPPSGAAFHPVTYSVNSRAQAVL